MSQTLYRAAFSQIDITPDFPVELIGCDRGGNLSQGVLHRLYAQVLLFKAEESIFCIAAIDSLGLTTALAQRLRKKMSKQLNTEVARVMLCFSHTHSAPEPTAGATNGERYFQLMCERITACIAEATAQWSPCRIGWALTRLNLGENRREGGTCVDDRLGALRIAHAQTDKPIAVLLRVTAHANVLMHNNNKISSDYFGVARETLHDLFGCPVMMIQGASGNIKPAGVHAIQGGDIPDLYRIADIIKLSCAGLRFDMQELTHIQMFSRFMDYYADVPTEENAIKTAMESGGAAAAWLAECERLRQCGMKEQVLNGEIQFFQMNGGGFCGLAEEIFCESALQVSETVENDLFFLNGYTNGCTGYLPTRDEWYKGGFETLYSYLYTFQYHGHVSPYRADTADQIERLAVSVWRERNKAF